MSAVPGTLANYKHRDVPFAIWFDKERISWCLDVREVARVYPDAQGKIICNLPGPAQAVLVGKKLIEDIWKSSRMAPQLPARKPSRLLPAPPPPPIELPPVPKRLRMPERWHEKHEAARRRVLEHYKMTIAAIAARGPFRTEDLACAAGRSTAATGVAVKALVKQGFIERAVPADPVTEQVKQLIEERQGQFTLRDVVDRTGVNWHVAEHLINRMRQRGLVHVHTPHRARKGVGGSSPAILELTAEGRRWMTGEVRWQFQTRSTYPHIYYVPTTEGQQQFGATPNPLSRNSARAAVVATIITGVSLLAVGIASRML